MTHAELNRWLRAFKYDPKYRDERGRRTVPLAPLCEFCGVSRTNVYHIARGEIPISRNMDERLTQAIRAVEAGLRFRRVGLTWQVTDPRFERLPRYERIQAPQRVAA